MLLEVVELHISGVSFLSAAKCWNVLKWMRFTFSTIRSSLQRNKHIDGMINRAVAILWRPKCDSHLMMDIARMKDTIVFPDDNVVM